MRRLVLLAILTIWHGSAHAEPGNTWKVIDPGTTEFSAAVDSAVKDYAQQNHPTAVMVVQDDLVIATAGDIAHKVNLRSTRKSLLGALIGIAVERSQIKLDSTLEQLGVDDIPPSLTAEEKQAMVRDLLMSRSGVYHPAAYETPSQTAARPPRGAHPPGTFWYYNNWDFNALGAIYEKATGQTPFKGFESLIARPIGMEDFTAFDGMFIGNSWSAFPAYVFNMSARDLARFGLLFMNKGRWNGAQIVPAQWVADSTRVYSQTDRKNTGYGYLWWVLDAKLWGDGAAFALGYGGQLCVIVPSKRLVAVQVTEFSVMSSTGIRSRQFLDLVWKIAQLTH
jgi:CubicO group peptidase (beta-lactamase class C family)